MSVKQLTTPKALQGTTDKRSSCRMHGECIASRQTEADSVANFRLVAGLDQAKQHTVVSGLRDALVQHRTHPLHHLVRVSIEKAKRRDYWNKKKGWKSRAFCFC